MNIFQARSCEQKIGNLNNLETFLHGEFSLPLIIANLICRADAQVHTHCYNNSEARLILAIHVNQLKYAIKHELIDSC